MKILCVGRNYVDHAKELNNPIPEDPVIFLKPESSILLKNNPFFIPDFSQEIHHEAELVVKINRIGKNINEKFAHKYYDEITLGIDFTARDLQTDLKSKGLPWEKAKAFDNSAAIGKFQPKGKYDLNNLNFTLSKNGNIVQRGNSSEMIFNIHHIIAHVSQFFTLKIGDLIYTGTPAGVSKVDVNDKLLGFLEEDKVFDFRIK